MNELSRRPGELRESVTLKSPTYNAAGDEIASWTTVASFQAAVEADEMTSEEAPDAMRQTSRQLMRLWCRHRTDVDTKMRITHRSVDYDIRAVMDPDQRRRWTHMKLRAVL